MNEILNILEWLALLTFLLVPAIWTLKNIISRGAENLHPANWPSLFSSLFLLVPGGLTIYWFNTDHKVMGVLAFVFYVMVVWHGGFWGAIFQSLRFNNDDDNDLVRRGSRVIEAHEMDALTANNSHSEDVTVGGVTIPENLQKQHFLISGTTGSGKTQIINGMLRSIRKHQNRAVIADPAGGFYARFGEEGDILLNPFDGRTVAWSPFAEIEADYDCERIAKAIVPDVSGESGEWHHYAQTLIAQVMLSMHRKGEKSIKKMLYWLTTADQKELAGLLEGSPAAALCAKGNDRMLSSTRGIISTYLGVFQYLPDEGDFSIRKWIQADDWRGNWLFITYRDDQMGLLRNLVATFLEIALVEGLSLPEDENRRLWYVMDEVDSLGKITSLRGGLTKLRKYGGRCILGLQTIAQLRTTYGRDEAQTLIANTSVKCILRAGDAETAKSMEQELGEQEIERLQVSDSYSINNGGDSQGQSTSKQIIRQAAVLSSELLGLPDLSGFLKLPGDEIAQIKVDYVKMPDVNPAFVKLNNFTNTKKYESSLLVNAK